MKTYLRLHVVSTVILGLLFSFACTSSSPKVSLLGVKAPKVQRFASPKVKVFIEVYNPGSSELNLLRLEYELVAKNLFNSSGQVQMNRLIPSKSTGIVEISVPVNSKIVESENKKVAYTLQAKLFGLTNKTQRSWNIATSGLLETEFLAAGLRLPADEVAQANP